MWDWVTGIRIRLSFSITLSDTATLHPSMTSGGLERIDRLGWKCVLSIELFLLKKMDKIIRDICFGKKLFYCTLKKSFFFFLEIIESQ